MKSKSLSNFLSQDRDRSKNAFLALPPQQACVSDIETQKQRDMKQWWDIDVPLAQFQPRAHNNFLVIL